MHPVTETFSDGAISGGTFDRCSYWLLDRNEIYLITNICFSRLKLATKS
jgi:hypothetical protein